MRGESPHFVATLRRDFVGVVASDLRHPKKNRVNRSILSARRASQIPGKTHSEPPSDSVPASDFRPALLPLLAAAVCLAFNAAMFLAMA